MKKTLITISLCCLIIFSGKSQSSSSSTSITTDDKKGSYTISINDGLGSLKIEASGEISFNETETAIENLSEDGYIRYKKNGKKITAEKGSDGKIYYTYNGGAKTQALNEEGNKFLMDAIRVMIEHGVDAKGHVARIYKKGGSAAVLNEFDNMKSDYVKKMMIEYLMKYDALSADEMTSIANKVGKQMSSDYEKAGLLSQFSGKYLSNPATAAAYLRAVKTIGSDYEKANALKTIFKQPLNDEMFAQVTDIANSVGSDYEKAGILEDIISNGSLNDTKFSAVIAAAKSIGSDYEKANVLEMIFSKSDIPQNHFTETIAAVASIGSDYEKSSVLQKLAGRKIVSEANWISIIQAAQNIGSDYEKANTLQAIAGNMPKTENVKSAFKVAAKTISSEYEYGKLVKSVDL